MRRSKPLVLAVVFAIAVAGPGWGRDDKPKTDPAPKTEKTDQDTDKAVLALSKDKWGWMSEKKVDALDELFHKEAVFVHMGGTMTRKQELDVIKSGAIHYKEVTHKEASVRVIDKTAVVLNTIDLLAIVGGREIINPFVVTEVYVKENDKWKLASLSFTRLNR